MSRRSWLIGLGVIILIFVIFLRLDQWRKITFPEQNIAIRCSGNTWRHDTIGLKEFPGSKEAACHTQFGAGKATTDLYGFNPNTNQLLYIAKEHELGTEIIFYERPTTELNLTIKNLVLQCGKRSIVGSPYESYTFLYPCTNEQALFACTAGTTIYVSRVSSVSDPLTRYSVRCDNNSEHIAERQSDGTWIDITNQEDNIE